VLQSRIQRSFFDDMRTLRVKYKTYAHGDPNADKKKLAKLHVEGIDNMMMFAVSKIFQPPIK
jgi:hypothetical protein